MNLMRDKVKFGHWAIRAVSLWLLVMLCSAADVTWQKMPTTAGWPGNNGYLTIPYDHVSQQTVLYGVLPNSVSIYSTDIYFYGATTNLFQHLGGTGHLGDNCAAGTPTQPSDRHPVGQMAGDTLRGFLWIYGGVCSGISRLDMYYLELHSNPLLDTWHQVTPTHFPSAINTSSMVYDSDDDVLFAFGSDGGAQTHDNWIYCRTTENPTPGIATTKQIAAGCTRPDDWNEVAVTGGTQPPGNGLPGMVYDSATQKVILWGGYTGGGTLQNQTWVYNPPTKTWARKALTGPIPPTYAYYYNPPIAISSTTHKVFLHLPTGSSATDWMYDPASDLWAQLTVSGTGPSLFANVLSFDKATGNLISYGRDLVNGITEMWQATLSVGPVNPPVIFGLSSASQTLIVWNTDTYSDTQVAYGLTTAYGGFSALNSALATTHNAVLSGLTPGTTYHYQVRSRDAQGQLSLGPDGTFTTGN